MADRALWIEGKELNALLGRQAVEPREFYPITYLDNWQENPGRFRCQVMDVRGGSACYFVTIPLVRLGQLAETEYDYGCEWES